jgi:hypothetical protein
VCTRVYQYTNVPAYNNVLYSQYVYHCTDVSMYHINASTDDAPGLGVGVAFRTGLVSGTTTYCCCRHRKQKRSRPGGSAPGPGPRRSSARACRRPGSRPCRREPKFRFYVRFLVHRGTAPDFVRQSGRPPLFTLLYCTVPVIVLLTPSTTVIYRR